MLTIQNQKVYFSTSETMNMIPNESITLVVTSPPYWNVRDYGSTQIGFNQFYIGIYIENFKEIATEQQKKWLKSLIEKGTCRIFPNQDF